MISLATSLPPTELSDAAMKLASTLLQIAVDPNATASRLAELATAQTTLVIPPSTYARLEPVTKATFPFSEKRASR